MNNWPSTPCFVKTSQKKLTSKQIFWLPASLYEPFSSRHTSIAKTLEMTFSGHFIYATFAIFIIWDCRYQKRYYLHFKGLRITTSPLLKKKVLEREVKTTIECNASNSLKLNVSWSFREVFLAPNFIGRSGDCNSSGIFQVRQNPNVLVICHLNYTLHIGNYTCYAHNQNALYSKTTYLNVLGK